MFADWGDRLMLKSTGDFAFSVTGEHAGGVPADERNLVCRAVSALSRAAGQEASGHLTLEKNIPAGSGVGGGSADAAAALRLFNRAWELDWPKDMLAGIATQIGSDVPACVWSRPLRMTGRGERIRLIEDWPSFHALLVNPARELSTADVFGAFDQSQAATGPAFRVTEGATGAELLKAVEAARNDLTVPAISIEPQIARVLSELDQGEDPLLVRMSGSGATCFAIYPDEKARGRAEARLQRNEPGWHIFPVVLQGSSAKTDP